MSRERKMINLELIGKLIYSIYLTKLDFDAEFKLDFNSGERINLELIR